MKPEAEDINRNITVIGFGNVKIPNIDTMLFQFKEQNKGAPIQFFDAKHIAGKQHMYFAAIHALNALNKKTNISNNIAIEALLYASAQRQIKKAVKMLGINQETTEVVALIIAKDNQEKQTYLNLVAKIIPGERNDNVIELTNKKIVAIKKMFKISEKEFKTNLKNEGLEREAITDLILEHMALLVTKS
jgi:tRNA threonylcarbamoyladenosine modification (KEOPS) complex Cgi121 subunit